MIVVQYFIFRVLYFTFFHLKRTALNVLTKVVFTLFHSIRIIFIKPRKKPGRKQCVGWQVYRKSLLTIQLTRPRSSFELYGKWYLMGSSFYTTWTNIKVVCKKKFSTTSTCKYVLHIISFYSYNMPHYNMPCVT